MIGSSVGGKERGGGNPQARLGSKKTIKLCYLNSGLLKE